MEISTSIPVGHGHPWMLVPLVQSEEGFMQGAVSQLFWAVGSGDRVLIATSRSCPPRLQNPVKGTGIIPHANEV